MDIFSCASQYCQNKIMWKVTKNIRNCLKAKLKKGGLVLGDSGNKDLFDLLEFLLEYLIQLNN